MKAPSLQIGDTIGVMAPSSYVEKEKIIKAKKLLEKSGYSVFLHPQYEAKFNQSAGTTEEKLKAFHELIADPSIKAIIAAGGGNRALHMLDGIDYDLVANNPKIIMGFSDVTALLNAVHAKTGITTIHGPVFTWLPAMKGMFDFNMGLLAGETQEYPMQGCRILREGTATGHLVGGNLSVFHLMPNTEYAPNTKGGILFIEDLREEVNKIDRMLLQLRRTGVLSEINGIICGSFKELGDNGRPYGFTLDDLLLEHTSGYDIPIVMDAPFGHGDQLYAMPIGGNAELYAGNAKVTLKLTESCVS
jgi:muramoyltetrapeptide carboxypeptidase